MIKSIKEAIMSRLNISNALDAYSQVKKTVDDLQAQKEALLLEKARLIARKQELYALPLSAADIKQFIFDYIDRIAAQYPVSEGWDSKLQKATKPAREKTYAEAHAIDTPTLCLKDAETILRGGNLSLVFGHSSALATLVNFAGVANGAPQAMYFFFGDLIKAKLGAYFDQRITSTVGDGCLSVSERYLELESIDETVSGLDAEVLDVTEKLKMLGAAEKPAIARKS